MTQSTLIACLKNTIRSTQRKRRRHLTTITSAEICPIEQLEERRPLNASIDVLLMPDPSYDWKIAYEQTKGPPKAAVTPGDGWGYGQSGDQASGCFAEASSGVESSVTITGGNVCNTYQAGQDSGTVKLWMKNVPPATVILVDVTYSISVTARGGGTGAFWDIGAPSSAAQVLSITVVSKPTNPDWTDDSAVMISSGRVAGKCVLPVGPDVDGTTSRSAYWEIRYSLQVTIPSDGIAYLGQWHPVLAQSGVASDDKETTAYVGVATVFVGTVS